MIKKIVVYKKHGEECPIDREVTGHSSQLYFQHGEGEGFAVTGPSDVSEETHYVRWIDEHVMERVPAGISYQADGLVATLEGIPIGSVVTVSGASLTTGDSQPLTIEFDLPGAYIVEIDPPAKYLSETLEVSVVDA